MIEELADFAIVLEDI